jgi:hypothetical protein
MRLSRGFSLWGTEKENEGRLCPLSNALNQDNSSQIETNWDYPFDII